MYQTCAFCSGALGGDGGASGLAVGRRFAYDGWKSRAWVICQRCGRWNLTPVDTRLDAVAALERMAASGRVAATTDQVALVRAGPYDVVRVGKPPRVELAGWRYGERLKAREREKLKVVVPVTLAALGIMVVANVAAGGSFGVVAWQFGNYNQIGNAVYRGIVGNRKLLIEPPVCAACGTVMVLRARHLRSARITGGAGNDLGLLVECPHCKREGALLAGPDAERALRAGLTYLNLKQRKRIAKQAVVAAQAVEGAGGPEELIHRTARHNWTLAKVVPDLRLALEMAVDEQAEVRDLEREWRRAEEIAEIADNLLVPPAIEDELKHLKERPQPDS
jgi:hypothetical protein